MPRSFSTVVSAAIGQHPRLFLFPELNLFCADTVCELHDLDVFFEKQDGTKHSYTAGLARALIEIGEIEGGPTGLAQLNIWLRDRWNWPTEKVFDQLLERVHPRIALVKSARIALSRKNIRRVLNLNPGARFIHLVRHPITNVASLINITRNAADNPGKPPEVPESAAFFSHLWCHVNLSTKLLLAELTDERRYLLCGEDLLNQPETTIRRIAEWIGIGAEAEDVAAMLHPEHSPFAVLEPQFLGLDSDPGFIASPRIRPGAKSSGLILPEAWQLPDTLCRDLRIVARNLGYEIPVSG